MSSPSARRDGKPTARSPASSTTSARDCSSRPPARTCSPRRAPSAWAPSCPTAGSPKTSIRSQGGGAPPPRSRNSPLGKIVLVIPALGSRRMDPEEQYQDDFDYEDDDSF